MAQVPIPDDWTGVYCCYSIQWPKSPKYLAILRGLIDLVHTGRYWLASTGNVIEAQAIIEATFDHNFQTLEVILDCGNDIGPALLAIAAALNNQNSTGGGSGSGCCPGGSAGGGQFPPEPATPSSDGLNPHTDPPPSGFPSWEDFDNQRCQEARNIVDDMELSLGRISVLLVAGLSIEGIVELLLVGLTLTISSAGIAAIAALIFTLGAVLIASTALSLINDNEDELICALLDGTDSVTSRNAFLAKFNEIADAASVDLIETFAIKQLVNYLLEIGETNRMYTYNPAIDYADADCEICEACLPDLEIIVGSGDVAPDETSRVLTSEPQGAFGNEYIRIRNNSVPCCDYFISFDASDGEPKLAADIFNCAEVGQGNAGGGLGGSIILYGAHGGEEEGVLDIYDAGPFTITVTIARSDYIP